MHRRLFDAAEPDARDFVGVGAGLSLDSIGAAPDTATASVDDYLEVVDRAVEHCGGRVNLIGDCRAVGWRPVYSALNPERVNTLTLAGAPINFRAANL